MPDGTLGKHLDRDNVRLHGTTPTYRNTDHTRSPTTQSVNESQAVRYVGEKATRALQIAAVPQRNEAARPQLKNLYRYADQTPCAARAAASLIIATLAAQIMCSVSSTAYLKKVKNPS